MSEWVKFCESQIVLTLCEQRPRRGCNRIYPLRLRRWARVNAVTTGEMEGRRVRWACSIWEGSTTALRFRSVSSYGMRLHYYHVKKFTAAVGRAGREDGLPYVLRRPAIEVLRLHSLLL